MLGDDYSKATDIIIEKDDPPEFLEYIYDCVHNIEKLCTRLTRRKIPYDMRFIELVTQEISSMNMAEDEVDSRKGIRLGKILRQRTKDWFKEFLL